jgi:hypothetical protein
MSAQRQIAWDEQDGEHVETDAYYHAQWHAYAVRRGLALFFLYTWIPVTVGLFLLSRHYIHEPVLSLVVIVLWLATAIALVYWSGEFRCPRCRRRYGALGHRKGDVNLTRGIFDQICSNCKLRKFENVR